MEKKREEERHKKKIALAVWGSVSSKHNEYRKDAVRAARRIAWYNKESDCFEIIVQCCGAGQGVMGSFVNECMKRGVHVRGYALDKFIEEAHPELEVRVFDNIGEREKFIIRGTFGVLVLPGGGVGTRKEFYCELIERERRGEFNGKRHKRRIRPIVFADFKSCYHGLLVDIQVMYTDDALRYTLDEDVWYEKGSAECVDMLWKRRIPELQEEYFG